MLRTEKDLTEQEIEEVTEIETDDIGAYKFVINLDDVIITYKIQDVDKENE